MDRLNKYAIEASAVLYASLAFFGFGIFAQIMSIGIFVWQLPFATKKEIFSFGKYICFASIIWGSFDRRGEFLDPRFGLLRVVTFVIVDSLLNALVVMFLSYAVLTIIKRFIKKETVSKT